MNDSADIVIVGGGAAGLAFAWRVAAPGLRVVLLEAGEPVDQRDAPILSKDWELAMQGRFNANPNLRRAPADYPVDDSESDIRPAIYNALGGSTIRWGAQFPRFRPSDFRMRTLDGVGRDWPVSYEDLAPYYDLNDRMMGVAGLAGDPANPSRAKRPCPPLPLCAATRKLAAALDELGWHWWPSDAAILSTPRDGRGACNHCGPCATGCPRHARASADLAYAGAARAAGVEIRTGTAVTALQMSADGTRIEAVITAEKGGVGRIGCGALVLAGNALGTARLLHPVYDHPAVGRGLMMHPTAIVTGRFPEAMQGWRGAFAASLLCQEFYETDKARGFVRGFQMQALRGQGPLTTALGGYNLPLPWGSAHAGAFTQTFGRTLSLTVTCDDLPEDINRIALDSNARDGLGMAVPRMIYRVGENSRRMLDFGIARATEALRTAGATDVVVNPLARNAGFHLMGTAHMGSDPDTSVTDDTGTVHGLANLRVVDASTFATAAAVNPTPTLQALALRSADALRVELGVSTEEVSTA